MEMVYEDEQDKPLSFRSSEVNEILPDILETNTLQGRSHRNLNLKLQTYPQLFIQIPQVIKSRFN